MHEWDWCSDSWEHYVDEANSGLGPIPGTRDNLTKYLLKIPDATYKFLFAGLRFRVATTLIRRQCHNSQSVRIIIHGPGGTPEYKHRMYALVKI